MIPNKHILTIPKLLDEGAEPKQSYKSEEAAERGRFIGDSYDLMVRGGWRGGVYVTQVRDN